MAWKTHIFDIITPCFCAGADNSTAAELRGASIRGQLRWWFRALGGFNHPTLAGKTVKEQEAEIFGSLAGGDGRASRLAVRVSPPPGQQLDDSSAYTTPAMQPLGYLLFPLRRKRKHASNLDAFALHVDWRGGPGLDQHIEALLAIFGHLGSLGFRSRRTTGALRAWPGAMGVKQALACFKNPGGIDIRAIDLAAENTSGLLGESRAARSIRDIQNPARCRDLLAIWLRAWRQHGSAAQPSPHQANTTLRWDLLKHDHDAGKKTYHGPVYRAALGLPIEQRFSSTQTTVRWDYGAGRRREPKGRFASPILLRPHQSDDGTWHALVIFVEALKWPNDPTTGYPKKVYLDGRGFDVSRDLYEAMKADAPRLRQFP